MYKKYFKTIVTLVLLLVVDRVFSQGPPPPPPPIDTPIDGGMFLLMAAGISYAVKSIWNKKK